MTTGASGTDKEKEHDKDTELKKSVSLSMSQSRVLSGTRNRIRVPGKEYAPQRSACMDANPQEFAVYHIDFPRFLQFDPELSTISTGFSTNTLGKRCKKHPPANRGVRK